MRRRQSLHPHDGSFVALTRTMRMERHLKLSFTVTSRLCTMHVTIRVGKWSESKGIRPLPLRDYVNGKIQYGLYNARSGLGKGRSRAGDVCHRRVLNSQSLGLRTRRKHRSYTVISIPLERWRNRRLLVHITYRDSELPRHHTNFQLEHLRIHDSLTVGRTLTRVVMG